MFVGILKPSFDKSEFYRRQDALLEAVSNYSLETEIMLRCSERRDYPVPLHDDERVYKGNKQRYIKFASDIEKWNNKQTDPTMCVKMPIHYA